MRKYKTPVIILILLLLVRIYFHYSIRELARPTIDGYHTGLLQKFSKKDNKIKTYEGELILIDRQHNPFGTKGTVNWEKFRFSVTDTNLVRRLMKMQGENILVHYWLFGKRVPWGENRFIVDSVKVNSENKGATAIRLSF